MPNTPNTSGPIDTSLNRSSPPDLAADANALMDEAKAAAGKIAEEAGEQIASLTDRAKQEVGDATEKVKSLAGDQKDQLADQMGGVAEAMERAANELDASNGETARYARMIADNAEKLSSTIRDNSVDDLLGMAQDFGRRQPAMFIGAAALLGFAASRFVMASAKRRETAAEPVPAYQPDSPMSPQQGRADGQSLGEM